uniref:Myosin-VI_CBD domain-containing protein n=1 Tax=Angiostrongylus cantonensis TaxID=6313 RepID=A0A158PAJ1_ANGCA
MANNSPSFREVYLAMWIFYKLVSFALWKGVSVDVKNAHRDANSFGNGYSFYDARASPPFPHIDLTPRTRTAHWEPAGHRGRRDHPPVNFSDAFEITSVHPRKQLEEKREKEEQRYQQAMAADAKQAEALRIAEEQKLAAAAREQLDGMIATRLSRDSGRAMIDTPTTSMSTSSSTDSSKPKGKHDLSAWRYAELRDAINTSTDMDLLLACKEEFHRRLRIYNAWKSRNQSECDSAAAPRAPNAVYANAQKRSIIAPQVNPALTMQRYFKVPFTRPADIYKTNNNNGLITDSRAVQNGRDDLRMCEIPLDQTGLTRKKGAEILESEFETVWLHLGGAPTQKWRP